METSASVTPQSDRLQVSQTGLEVAESSQRTGEAPCSKARLSLVIPSVLALFVGSANNLEARQIDPLHGPFDTLVKRFIVNGLVDYASLKADPAPLEAYLRSLGAVTESEFNTWDESRQLAFLFNLYNAATVRLIVDHYPVKSIKDIGSLLRSPWKQPVVSMFGRTVTLDHVEHDFLRKKYDEPRLHVALVCAAIGCPPLRSEAYTATRLGEQLDDQSRRFLAGRTGLRIDRGKRVVYFSSIFKWYGGDFRNRYAPGNGFSGLDATERAVASFAAQYVSSADRAFLQAGGYDVKYLDYDWSLNERR